MKCNAGTLDRAARVILGLVLIALNFVVEGVAPWGWVGVIPLVTGAIGWCPLYLPFGINTCAKK